MKSLKLYFAVCALFVCTCGFAQSGENKRTREETVAWLKEKLIYYSIERKYKDGSKDTYEFAFTECELICNFCGFDGDNRIYKFPLRAFIEYVEPENDNKSPILRFSEGKCTYYKYNRIDERTFWWLERITPEMGKRIENAIKHLATFCTQKEAF